MRKEDIRTKIDVIKEFYITLLNPNYANIRGLRKGA
jgi:hypothetical protein